MAGSRGLSSTWQGLGVLPQSWPGQTLSGSPRLYLPSQDPDGQGGCLLSPSKSLPLLLKHPLLFARSPVASAWRVSHRRMSLQLGEAGQTSESLRSSVFLFIKWVPTTPAYFRALMVPCMLGTLRGGQEWKACAKTGDQQVGIVKCLHCSLLRPHALCCLQPSLFTRRLSEEAADLTKRN